MIYCQHLFMLRLKECSLGLRPMSHIMFMRFSNLDVQVREMDVLVEFEKDIEDEDRFWIADTLTNLMKQENGH